MQLHKDLRLRKVKDKNFIVAVNEFCENFYGMVKLNDTAAFVFNCLKKKNSLDKIIKKVVKEYGIDENTAHKDVEAIIEQFKKAGFIND